jgi:hypothetical protein
MRQSYPAHNKFLRDIMEACGAAAVYIFAISPDAECVNLFSQFVEINHRKILAMHEVQRRFIPIGAFYFPRVYLGGQSIKCFTLSQC